MLVERSVEGHVATVTLNRPEAANSLNVAMRDELIETWRWIEGTAEIRAVVLTGAGTKVFCAGSDLKDPGLDDFGYLADELFGSPPREHFQRGLVSTKPVVCAINGHALGGGLELALTTDIRVSAQEATFGFPEVQVGSMAGAGATQYLPRLVGMSAASYLLLTGSRIHAKEAERIGLINECLPAEEVLARATAIARTIADNAPLSVRATRRAVRASAELPLSQGLELERNLWGLVRATEDRAEGRRAFRAKRTPRFTGK